MNNTIFFANFPVFWTILIDCYVHRPLSPNLKFGNGSGRISTRFEGLSRVVFGFFKSLYLCNCLELVVEISRAFKSEQTRSFPQIFS